MTFADNITIHNVIMPNMAVCLSFDRRDNRRAMQEFQMRRINRVLPHFLNTRPNVPAMELCFDMLIFIFKFRVRREFPFRIFAFGVIPRPDGPIFFDGGQSLKDSPFTRHARHHFAVRNFLTPSFRVKLPIMERALDIIANDFTAMP